MMMSWSPVPRELNEFAVSVTLTKGKQEASWALIEAAMRSVFYAAVVAIFLMVVALVVKLMWTCDSDETGGEARPTENTRLVTSSKEALLYSPYGTNEDDLESGKGSCSGDDLEASSGKASCSGSSSDDDLYDESICAICYDEQRNCLFIPCGHCVTCYTCAKRILNEESKTCPICRTIIQKGRRMQIL